MRRARVGAALAVLAVAMVGAGCLADGLKPAAPTFVSVEGGSFTMGSNEICADGDGPLCGGDHGPHPVTVDAFQMADREITRAEWAACQQAHSCPAADGINLFSYRVDRPDDPVMVNDPRLALGYCSLLGARLPTEAEFELAQRGGNAEKLTTFPWGDSDSPPASGDVTPGGIRNLATGAREWVLDGYVAALGCPDRLTAEDVCPSLTSCCGADGCVGLCAPDFENEAALGDVLLACAPGTFGAGDVNPVYANSLSAVVIRGRNAGERSCFRAGYTRRHASIGAFTAGFRCVRSEASLRTPAAFRFRLDACAAGMNVDISSSGEFRLDVFQNGGAASYSSVGRQVSGLPCDATFVLRGTNDVTATSTSGTCTVTWQDNIDLSNGDSPSSGVLALQPTTNGECTTTCQGADLMNDPNNCGFCGNRCAATSTCMGGVCSCGAADLASDTHNCGACGHDCFGPACVGGECLPGLVADSQSSPFAIVADSTNLYFSNRVGPNGSVVGCTPGTSMFNCTTLADNLQRPGLLAVDNSNVYWANYDNATVDSCAKGGCALSPSVLDSPGGGALGVALEGGSLLYTLNTGGAIKECVLPDCGSGAKMLVSGQTTGSFGPYGIAADKSNLYYTINGIGGSLRSCPRAGCGILAPQVLLSGLNDPQQLLLDGGFLYFVETGGPTLRRWNIVAATAETLAAKQSGVTGVATDPTHVFWTHAGDGTIWFCQKSNCQATARIIAQGQTMPTGIAVLGAGVFWTNSGSGQVMGMAIPLDNPPP